MLMHGTLVMVSFVFSLFFFNDTATTEIYTLSLHDALPICVEVADQDALEPRAQRPLQHRPLPPPVREVARLGRRERPEVAVDRKSTRLNSSHANISYAVFCLKKKY